MVAKPGLGAIERSALRALAALEQPVISSADVMRATAYDRVSSNLLLSRLARKGWLHRLRRGVYALVPLSSASNTPVLQDPLAAAMELFAPCYVSGWTAAHHWGLTEQLFNSIVVYSARPQRRSEHLIGGITYRVRHVPERAIFGTTRIWSGPTPVEMASVHRTMIDALDVPHMAGGGRQVLDIAAAYWERRDARPDDLLTLAERLGRRTVFKRLGFTAENFAVPSSAWVARCQEQMSTGVSLFDPEGPRRGPIVSRWRIRINVPLAGVQ